MNSVRFQDPPALRKRCALSSGKQNQFLQGGVTYER